MPEIKKATRPARSTEKVDGESAVIEAIKAMPEPYCSTGMRLHEVMKAAAPSLMPKTWYRMPAYAKKDGKIVLWFRGGDKFKERYMTIGFNDVANLDDGNLWPISYALTELTPADEARITELVNKAIS